MKGVKTLLNAITVAVLIAGCASTQAGKDSDTGALNGWWRSSVNSSWGGALTVTMTPPANSRFSGTALFYNSACPWQTQFDGTIQEDGKITFTVNLGGRCGQVVVELTPHGDGYTGTYRADFPDNGSVTLQK